MNPFTDQEVEEFISMAFTAGTLSPTTDFRQSNATGLFFSLCEQRGITHEDLTYGYIKYPRIDFNRAQTDAIYKLIEQAFIDGQTAQKHSHEVVPTGFFSHRIKKSIHYKDSSAFLEFTRSKNEESITV